MDVKIINFQDKNSELLGLSAVMRNPKLIDKFNLTEDSFTGEKIKKVFRIIDRNYKKGLKIDENLIKNELKTDFEFIDRIKILEVKNDNIFYTIRKMELLRELVKSGFKEIAKTFFNPNADFENIDKEWDKFYKTNIEDILAVLSRNIDKLKTQYSKSSISVRSLLDLDAAINAFQEKIERGIELPEFPMKLIPGAINLIVAATGTGKTTYLQSMAISSLKNKDGKVLYISLEQPEETIGSGIREMCNNEMIANEDRGRLGIVKIPSGDISEIRSNLVEIFSFYGSQGPATIIIDYMKPSIINGEGSGYEKMGKMINTIQEIVEEFASESVVFVAVQGNTNSEGRSLKEIANSPSRYITEGSRTLETASTCLFISKNEDNSSRSAVIVKSRYENDKIEKKYDVLYHPGRIIQLREKNILLGNPSEEKKKVIMPTFKQ